MPVNIMDVLWLLCCRADILWRPVNHKSGISGKLSDIFLDSILETSDATYRHQSCMTAVSHMHTYSTRAHTLKYKQSTHADIHLPAMLKTYHIFINDTEDYTRRQW